MEFSMGACSGGARIGSLQLGEGLHFETPGLLMLTQKGLPAIIPPDMLLDLHPDSRLCQFTPLHFLEYPLSFIVAKAGGIHKLSSLTGFGMVAVARDSLVEEPKGESSSESGVSFEASGGHIVGPETYMEVVNACKPDLWVSLPDGVLPWVDEKRNRLSVDCTLKWLDQCLLLQNAEYGNRCLGVVVGASSLEERIRSAQQTASRNVAGFSLGGFGMGEDVAQRALHIESAVANLPEEKLRHVCGLGLPEEILQAVGAGIDLFDSTGHVVISKTGFWGESELNFVSLSLLYSYMLTKAGYAMTFPLTMENASSSFEKQPTVEKLPGCGSDSAKINLRSSIYRLDEDQLVAGCKCYTCQRHSRAYIYNLMDTQEMLAQTLLEIHNTYHYLEFFKAIRDSIKINKFDEFSNWFTSKKHEREILTEVSRCTMVRSLEVCLK